MCICIHIHVQYEESGITRYPEQETSILLTKKHNLFISRPSTPNAKTLSPRALPKSL